MNTCKQCGTKTDMPWLWPAGDLCPACQIDAVSPSKMLNQGQPSKILGGVEDFKTTATIHLTPEDAGFECVARVTREFRELKATMPALEFSVIQWAAKRAGAGHTAQALDVFMRLALLERVREVVRAEIKRGKAIPPDIAAVMDEKRER